jgi:predicted transcriptional regulator
MRGVWAVRILLLTCLLSAVYGSLNPNFEGSPFAEQAEPEDNAAFEPASAEEESADANNKAESPGAADEAPVLDAPAGEAATNPFLTGGLLGMGLVMLSGLVFEFIRVVVLVALVAPMLATKSRHREDDLTKGRILGYIEANAGIHFSALRDGLGLANGVTAYHTNNLEREGKIFSWKSGKNRRYASSSVPKHERKRFQNPLTGTRLAVLEVLAEKGQAGTTTKELRERLDISRQLLSHHLNDLKANELIERAIGNERKAWRVSKNGSERLQASRSLQKTL